MRTVPAANRAFFGSRPEIGNKRAGDPHRSQEKESPNSDSAASAGFGAAPVVGDGDEDEIGLPQRTQEDAFEDISAPHSSHWINAMMNFLFENGLFFLLAESVQPPAHSLA